MSFLFVVVNVKDSGKRKVKRGRTVEKVNEYFTGGGERFYIADVLDSEKGVNWDEVARFLGRHSSHILINKKISLPENSAVSRFEPVKFKNVLIFNTLELLLKQMYLAGCRTVCYINDPKGDYALQLPKIAAYSAQTTVITDNRFRYLSQIAQVYDKFGAGVVLSDKADIKNSNAVVIDTAGTVFGGAGVIFSPFDNGITPKYIDSFNDIKSLCPPFLESIDFLGAVYELNREKRLNSAICRTFSHCGNDIRVLDLLERLIPRKTVKNPDEKSIIFTV